MSGASRRTVRPDIPDDGFGDFEALVNEAESQLESSPENPYEREISEPSTSLPAPSSSPVPGAPAPAHPAAVPKARVSSARVQITVRINPSVRERARNTVYWLSGPPERLGMQDMIERSLESLCISLEREYNNGKPFPARPGELKRGRRA